MTQSKEEFTHHHSPRPIPNRARELIRLADLLPVKLLQASRSMKELHGLYRARFAPCRLSLWPRLNGDGRAISIDWCRLKRLPDGRKVWRRDRRFRRLTSRMIYYAGRWALRRSMRWFEAKRLSIRARLGVIRDASRRVKGIARQYPPDGLAGLYRKLETIETSIRSAVAEFSPRFPYSHMTPRVVTQITEGKRYSYLRWHSIGKRGGRRPRPRGPRLTIIRRYYMVPVAKRLELIEFIRDRFLKPQEEHDRVVNHLKRLWSTLRTAASIGLDPDCLKLGEYHGS